MFVKSCTVLLAYYSGKQLSISTGRWKTSVSMLANHPEELCKLQDVSGLVGL